MPVCACVCVFVGVSACLLSCLLYVCIIAVCVPACVGMILICFTVCVKQQVDKINPLNAARLTAFFSTFRRYDESRQILMKAQLQRLLDTPGLSKDTYEIASRSMKG